VNQHTLACLGQADPVVCSIKQPSVEFLFQLPDLVRHSRLSHMQHFGGTRKTQHTGDRVKHL